MCQVVHYKAQFSWTMERYVNWSAKQREKYLAQAHALMNGVRVKKLDSEDILHYHADYVNPKWAKHGTLVAKAGTYSIKMYPSKIVLQKCNTCFAQI